MAEVHRVNVRKTSFLPTNTVTTVSRHVFSLGGNSIQLSHYGKKIRNIFKFISKDAEFLPSRNAYKQTTLISLSF